MDAWDQGFTSRSNFAKSNPEYVGIAASLGLITLLCPDGSWGKRWRLTDEGYVELYLRS